MLKSTLAVTAAGVLTLGLTAAPAAADSIIGTDGNDSLRGTPRSDLMQGLAGNDKLRGRLGNDLLLGGAGVDILYAGDRSDETANAGEGGPGNDLVVGGRGFTFMEGNEGDDGLNQGPFEEGGPDYGRGHDGDDLITLGKKPDGAEPDWGADVVFMGAANDYVFVYPDGDKDFINCGRGERDVVELVDRKERRDTLKNCETVFVSGDDTADDARWRQ